MSKRFLQNTLWTPATSLKLIAALMASSLCSLLFFSVSLLNVDLKRPAVNPSIMENSHIMNDSNSQSVFGS